ncbi:MAG TPA: hypothetical protein VJ757_07985 [Pseudonocardiaceae bacterium]|nr:hypothetical protein [Pseudonocardiaceae bacterium]
MSVTIDWGALGMVFFVSFGSAVGVIVLFAVGVSALAERNCAPSQASQKVTGPRWARPVATLCFLGCALVVVYGLYLIIK